MKGILVTVLALCFFGACTTTETLLQARGTGEKRIFNSNYGSVYTATLSAASKQGLTLTSADKSNGQILLSHGLTPWSWGERVAVFVTKLSDDRTQVEIVSKPVMVPLNFPPDWTNKLFDAIYVELKPSG
jgi:hypothetical protein